MEALRGGRRSEAAAAVKQKTGFMLNLIVDSFNVRSIHGCPWVASCLSPSSRSLFPKCSPSVPQVPHVDLLQWAVLTAKNSLSETNQTHNPLRD